MKKIMVGLVCLLSMLVAAQAAKKPNVILIFTDDHGYADLSCQGVFDDLKTPNIDSMAACGWSRAMPPRRSIKPEALLFSWVGLC